MIFQEVFLAPFCWSLIHTVEYFPEIFAVFMNVSLFNTAGSWNFPLFESKFVGEFEDV
jgi:hypothetical protein